MIHKFHPDSQKELVKSARELVVRVRGMISIGEVAKAFTEALKEGEGGARSRILSRINERRLLLLDVEGNHWSIYELCKQVYELAELDFVDFNGSSYEDKFKFICLLIPFVNHKTIRDGVLEYHESRVRDGWRMNWIVERERAEQEALMNEVLQLNQDILISFIQSKGLIDEFQSYVANYELIDEGPAAH